MSHLVHNGVSVLCVAGGEGKAAKFSAGSFYPASQADYCSCAKFTEGNFLIKKTQENSRNGNRKETAHWYREWLHPWGTFEDVAHISSVSAAGRRERHMEVLPTCLTV